jgi:hypothetical protein
MCLGQTFHDRQPKAGTFIGDGDIMTSLTKTLKHPRVIFGVNSDTGITYTHDYLGGFRDTGKSHNLAASGRELDSVGKQIDEDLPQCPFVRMQQRQIACHIGDKCQSAVPRARSHQPNGGVDQSGEVHFSLAKYDPAGFDPREI